MLYTTELYNSSITHVFCYYFAKIKGDSYDSLPVEKTLTLHNVIKLIKSVLNKDQNPITAIYT